MSKELGLWIRVYAAMEAAHLGTAQAYPKMDVGAIIHYENEMKKHLGITKPIKDIPDRETSFETITTGRDTWRTRGSYIEPKQ